MDTTVTEAIEIPELAAGESVVFHEVSWDEYLRLRGEDDGPGLRMLYDQGELTLMSPSYRHERVVQLLALLVVAWMRAMRIDFVPVGAVTCQREDLRRGFQSDNCWYIEHEAVMRGKDSFDLTIDPPPDLAVEVDVSRDSEKKLPVYAAFSVPEVWIWKNGQLRIFILTGDDYEEFAESAALPGFPLDLAATLVRRGPEDGINALLDEFHEAIKKS